MIQACYDKRTANSPAGGALMDVGVYALQAVARYISGERTVINQRLGNQKTRPEEIRRGRRRRSTVDE